jgi:site-specific DNA-methyltransferase (adenine-specific)
MEKKLGKIHNKDCVAGMNSLPEGSVDLVFADPPFNIGYKYDVYEDKMAAEDYLAWSNEWMTAAHRALKPDGTFWLAIGDDFAAELKIEARKIGFHCRSWVIWYYTFGVNCKNKFTRSHTHLFHFVKDPENFTFRAEDLDNRVPSARMLVYNDKRAKGNGRLPDDTWIIPPDIDEPNTFVLRPQEIEHRFKGTEDTWYIPRVAGTFKERAGFHGCQMPEQLLGRIIRTCSLESEIVLDPFAGSASTLVTAKKLGRKYVGFEMSRDYAEAGRSRLHDVRVGDRLDGSPEPTMDAFNRTRQPKGKRRISSKEFAEEADLSSAAGREANRLKTIEAGIVRAFTETHEGKSADVLLAEPELNDAFLQRCESDGLPGVPLVWNRLLLRIRKRTSNPLPATTQRVTISFEACESYLFASEIAWKMLIEEDRAGSLDDILCDPELATEFDRVADQFAPGYSSFEYRWAALRIRKFAKKAKQEAQILKEAGKHPRSSSTKKTDIRKLPDSPGIYIVSHENNILYVGSAFSLRHRIETLIDRASSQLKTSRSSLALSYCGTGTDQRELFGWCSHFISNAPELPRLNVPDLRVTP